MTHDIWTDLLERGVGLCDKLAHIMIMPGQEVRVPCSERSLLFLTEETKPIVPDVVLGQAYINIERDIVLRASDQSLDCRCRSD